MVFFIFPPTRTHSGKRMTSKAPSKNTLGKARDQHTRDTYHGRTLDTAADVSMIVSLDRSY